MLAVGALCPRNQRPRARGVVLALLMCCSIGLASCSLVRVNRKHQCSKGPLLVDLTITLLGLGGMAAGLAADSSPLLIGSAITSVVFVSSGLVESQRLAKSCGRHRRY